MDEYDSKRFCTLVTDELSMKHTYGLINASLSHDAFETDI